MLLPPLLLLFIFYSMKNNFHGLVTCSRLLIYHDKDEAFSPSSSEFLIYHRFTVQCFPTSAALCVTAWLPVFHLTFTDGKHASPGGNNPCMHAIIQTLSHQHQFSCSFFLFFFFKRLIHCSQIKKCVLHLLLLTSKSN